MFILNRFFFVVAMNVSNEVDTTCCISTDLSTLEQVKYIFGWLLVAIAIMGIPVNLLPVWLLYIKRSSAKRRSRPRKNQDSELRVRSSVRSVTVVDERY